VQRAEQAGYEALVLTIDAACSGVRDRERHAAFRLPADIAAVNLAGLPPPAAPTLSEDQSRLFDGLLKSAPTWDDIAWLQSCTRLPILLKGVLHEGDARQAKESGIDGLIVSNHGERTLDTVPPTSAVLPRIREAVGEGFPLLVDGGIRRGTDVLKAIALSANAVLIGRPYIYGLANAGAMGVSHVIRLLRDELEIAMALCGCKTLAEADASILFK
jgi:4-hydroxymandelate oxidase